MGLIQAMNEVMKEVGYVQKDKTMTFGERYSYAGEAAFIAAIRPPMVEHGIVFCPIRSELVHHEQYQNSKGTLQNRVVISVTFRFSHVSGETLDVSAMGEGIDSGDKATPKAMTSALKYALRQSFVIETGDDPDDTPSAHQERGQPRDAEAVSHHEQALAAAEDKKGFDLAIGSLQADIGKGLISEQGKAHLRTVAADTKKRLRVK